MIVISITFCSFDFANTPAPGGGAQNPAIYPTGGVEPGSVAIAETAGGDGK